MAIKYFYYKEKQIEIETLKKLFKACIATADQSHKKLMIVVNGKSNYLSILSGIVGQANASTLNKPSKVTISGVEVTYESATSLTSNKLFDEYDVIFSFHSAPTTLKKISEIIHATTILVASEEDSLDSWIQDYNAQPVTI